MGRKSGDLSRKPANSAINSDKKKARPYIRRKKKLQKGNEVSPSQQLPNDTSLQPRLHTNTKNTNKGKRGDEDDDDDYDDTDYDYQDTDSDDDDSMDDVETDELAYLLSDQKLAIDNHHIPTLYYPTLKNRFYTTMRSVKIEHIYTALKGILIFISLLVLVVQIGRMQSNVRKNGYCDSYYKNRGGGGGDGETVGFFATQIGIVNRQSCITCPANGECINGELFCKPLYRPHRSLLNKIINLVWPIGQQCIKDPVMINYATKMERKIRAYLSRRQGEFQCHDCTFTTPSDKLGHLTTYPLVKTNADVMMDTLKHSFGLPRAYNQNHQVELDHLADLALDMVKKNRHVMSWEIEGVLYLGTDIANYSFLCWCWVTLCGAPLSIKASLPIFALGYGLVMLLTYHYRAWATKKHQVKMITEKALELLKTQRQNHLMDSTVYRPGCSTSYLRQHIMESADEDSIDIWKSVVEQLQKHPCLRHGHTDENGDLLQYFEWL